MALTISGWAWAQEAALDVPEQVELSALSKQKRAAYRVAEDERDSALREVAAAYGRVADDETRSHADRTEAAFRAGEILRARQDADAAYAWFHVAHVRGQAGQGDGREREFAARAWLEMAHMHRRGDEIEDAQAIYEALPREFDDQRRSAAHATTWLGKLHLNAEDFEPAAEILLGFADAFPEYPEEAVRNADLVSLAYLDEGRVQDAQAVIARIEEQMSQHLEGEGRVADSVRAALEAMRIRERLSADAG